MSVPTVTRRQALTAAAGVAVIAGAPALALAGPVSGRAIPADPLLVAAEAEITRLYSGMAETLSDREANAITNEAWRLDDLIAVAVPASLADCAVKLRRVLDREVGMVAGSNDRDVRALALALALDYIETVTEAPTHATRPIARTSDEDDGT